MDLPESLQKKLDARAVGSALRKLTGQNGLIDFASNDYLGFAQSDQILRRAMTILESFGVNQNGSTGSRLISGNHPLHEAAEKAIANFHNSESSLLFNSGYDANLGFFSSVAQRGDTILYDELSHASIRDGIRLSNANAFRFRHNDLEHLEELIGKYQKPGSEIFIATESVFSMDGDSPAIVQLVALAKNTGCRVIVDEAHALGVFGDNGQGLLQEFGLEGEVFARIVTFGKALGCHGAAVLCSGNLREYLINFARSFIYTTALPPHSAAVILSAYEALNSDPGISQLRDNIAFFNREKSRLGIQPLFVGGKSAIASAIIPGNEKVRSVALAIQNNGFDVRAILSPTIPAGQERLRICIHSFNSEDEISRLLNLLASLMF